MAEQDGTPTTGDRDDATPGDTTPDHRSAHETRPADNADNADNAGSAEIADNGAPVQYGPYGPYNLYTPDPVGDRRKRRRNVVVGLLASVAVGGLLVVATVTYDGTDPDVSNAADTSAVSSAPTGTTGSKQKSPSAPPRTRIAEDDLRELAEAQTTALNGGDLPGFLAPYDPTVDGLTAERTRLFSNLKLIPFESASFRFDRLRGNDTANDTGPLSTTANVSFVHHIAGVDNAPIAETYRWTVSRASVDAPLRITKVEGGPGGNAAYPQAWDITELKAVAKPHVTFLVDKATGNAKAEAWAGRAEKAAVKDFDIWQGPAGIPQKFIVFAAPDRKTYDKLMGESVIVPGSTGFCSTLPADKPGGAGAAADRVMAGSRITVDTSDETFSDPGAQTDVFRHEMGHALIGGFTKGQTEPPLWVIEGFAGYFEWYDRSLDEWTVPAARTYIKNGKFDGKLPTDEVLYGDDSKASGVNYHFSMLAIRYIADKYGHEKAQEFVLKTYQDPSSLEASLTAATGMSKNEFESKWAQFVKAKSK